MTSHNHLLLLMKFDLPNHPSQSIFFCGLYEKDIIFSVFTIADFIASSLEKPFRIPLQYFLEKLFEILFCSKLTLGSEVSNAKPTGGFIR